MSMLNGKLNIPKIVRPLELSEYHPDLDLTIYVWVNISRKVNLSLSNLVMSSINNLKIQEQIREMTASGEASAAIKEKENILTNEIDANFENMLNIYAEIWGQHKDEDKRLSVDEVRQIVETSMEEDNQALWIWLTNRTQQMIKEHREAHLKN